jgi:hypothetical protein
MLAALPIIVGLQFILAALDFDVKNVPSVPINGLVPIGIDDSNSTPS